MAERMTHSGRLSTDNRLCYRSRMPPRDDRRIPDLVSVTEAATTLGVTRQAILKMVENGRLAGRKVGATWVFRRATVDRYREDQP